MKRRSLIALAGAAAIVGLTAGTALAKVQISVTICCEQVDRAEWLQAVADAYMKENPNVEVHPVINVGLDKLTTMIAGGVGPDLIWLASPGAVRWATLPL